MKRRICFLAIDAEEDYKDGRTVNSFYGIHKLPFVLDLLNKLNVKSTVFCTGKVLDFQDILLPFKASGHEMGLHGFFDHVLCLNQSREERKIQLQRQIEKFENLFLQSPKGFRAVQNRIDAEGLKILSDSQFLYDSSPLENYPIFKKYVGFIGRTPKEPYHPSFIDITEKDDKNLIWEIPLVSLLGGVQLQGKWIRKLGSLFFSILISFSKPQILSLSFHSWDLLEDPKLLVKLEKIITKLKKNNYEFLTGSEIVDFYSQKHV